ncbi:hypothetical protein thalar_00892 [Litoreibacter arenae DSM 19593]|uniref:Uncharacterized protein n=1 Tax=Litoreibacter arenae DSM 19593 TaxID=1123360 RepID=S9QLQ8_9RHOB|nr:hypothetical protein thalar_00892 [Litoreibacter arenae DSM 19593]
MLDAFVYGVVLQDYSLWAFLFPRRDCAMREVSQMGST